MVPIAPAAPLTHTQAFKFIEPDYTVRLGFARHRWAYETLLARDALVGEASRRRDPAYYAPALVELEIANADKRAEWAYQTCCEIWNIQRRQRCPAFFRAVLACFVEPMFSLPEGYIMQALQQGQDFTCMTIPENLSAITMQIERGLAGLRAKWTGRLLAAQPDEHKKPEDENRSTMLEPQETPRSRTETEKDASQRDSKKGQRQVEVEIALAAIEAQFGANRTKLDPAQTEPSSHGGPQLGTSERQVEIRQAEREAQLTSSQSSAHIGIARVESHGGHSARRPSPKPASTSTANPITDSFQHSENYCSIRCRGTKYRLTEAAACVVKLLHEAQRDGLGGLSASEIRKSLKCGKVWDQFRSLDGRKFFAEMIDKPDKDYFKLKL